MQPLASLFEFASHETIAIIGSGGKTTLLWYLAQYFRQEKVLVTPSTKMFLPQSGAFDRFYDPVAFAALGHASSADSAGTTACPCSGGVSDAPDFADAADHTAIPCLAASTESMHAASFIASADTTSFTCPVSPPDNAAALNSADFPHTAEQGISLAGQRHVPESETDVNTRVIQPVPLPMRKRRPVDNPEAFLHKITSLDPEILAAKQHLFDKILMECDGARNLPLKGWASYEPVIYDVTTSTVAVIPLWVLGREASESFIHRPGLFFDMARCQPGETLKPEHLARVIAHPQGLLAKGKGAVSLLLHIKEACELPLAHELVALLPQSALGRCRRIIGGSARTGQGAVVWKTPV